jgi:hypothetical protein
MLIKLFEKLMFPIGMTNRFFSGHQISPPAGFTADKSPEN